MSKIIGLISIAILLSGCALGSTTWTKRGATQAQGEKDMAECAQKANLLNASGEKVRDGVIIVGGSVLGGDADKPGVIFQKCMQDKGYKKVK